MNINLLTSGYLEICIGPMFSGKTSHLLKKIGQMADTGYSVLLINHDSDTRDSLISSHSSLFKGISDKIVDKITIIKKRDLNINVDEFDVIGIDEIQFFDNLDNIIEWVDIKQKIVFVSGLDGDFQRNPIGKVLSLIPFADKVEKINAKCHMCTDIYKGSLRFRLVVESPFTARKGEDKNQILIGSDDKYVSLCRYHFLNQGK